MIKNNALRRFVISTLFLLVGILLYKYPENLVYKDDTDEELNVYLIDRNNYVAMVKVGCDSNGDYVRDVFNCLITDILPDGFDSYIPVGTKLLDYSIDGDLLKLNFSKEFNDVKKGNEEKLIEMIIYSFTNIDGINKIMIFVEGELLDNLPNNNKKLPIELDRSYGINKVIEINTISNSVSFNVYYLGKEDDYYYIPVTYVVNGNDDVVQMMIRKLKNNGINSSLLTHLTSNVDVLDYKVNDDSMDILFNKELENIMSDGILDEEVKYMLVMSLSDTFGIDGSNIEINY